MKKIYLPVIAVALAAFVIAMLIMAHRNENSAFIKAFTNTFRVDVNPAFREYVRAFTAGAVSTKGTVKVRLADDFADSLSLNMPLEEVYFRFKPAVAGKTFWSDSRTLEFRPDEILPQDQEYKAEFFLSKLVKVPDSLRTLVFGFKTIRQEVEVIAGNHKAVSHSDLSREFLDGSLLTSDFADDAKVEEVLKVRQDGRLLPVTWTHDARRKMHTFRVDSVIRKNSVERVTLEWDGGVIGSGSSGKREVEIQPLGRFVFEALTMTDAAEACLLVRFSDPLLPGQDLNGLIRIGNQTDMRYTVDDNELRIYLPQGAGPKSRLTLESAIRNISRKELGKKITEEVMTSGTKPDVRFAGDGSIMPSSNGMLLPFEAVNLKAVNIKVVRIFESNILRFLQVNDLNGNSELVRVGRVVLKKTIPLTGVTNYSRWNRFSIDLSSLMKTEPGAIYTVILSFKRSFSVFPCGGQEADTDAETELVVTEDPDEDNDNEWNYYSNYTDNDFDDGGWRDYRWEERDDPCKPSYYFNKSVTRNVLSSDLGIIVKAGEDKDYRVYVTNLLTAKPLSGVHVEFYNFQLQKMGEASTNEDGMADMNFKSKPFIAMARHERQTGYLKLTEGSALSLSMFDVSGEPVKKGLKGFLFGERGVWRPGDSLFLTFILEDKTHRLPLHHPVSLSLVNPAGQLVTRMVKTTSTDGFYTFATATSPEAPTGNWLATVSVGGVDFQKSLKIETVKPNRLKISFDFRTDRLVRDKIPAVTLGASWLTGSPASGLKALVNLTLTKSKTSFSKFPGYTFDDPTAGFGAENTKIFEGKLDAGGSVQIRPEIHLTHTAPGVLKANFETMVFEEGGNFSIDRFSIPYYPYQSYAGLSIPGGPASQRVLNTGTTHTIPLLNIDPDGNPVSSGKLKVEVFKLDWRWWWDNSESGSADFISTAHIRPVQSEVVITSGGKGDYRFLADDDDWGRYLIKVTDVASGHAAARVVYVDWPGYYRLPGGEKQAAAMLTLSASKDKYRVGEEVKLTLPTSPEGSALVTIESGSAVLQSFWIPTTKGTTEIRFVAAPEMAPNCYAYVTVLQPHAQVKNDLPVRLYGVIPVAVEDPASHLKPVIGVPREFVPGKTATITVKESEGKPMTYTVAVVDEGLLDLTRFKTPDPWSVFYAREALGVKTWDLYDQVMGAYSGELQRILSIGGDQDGGLKGSLKANRFKPMVKYFGPFKAGKGETRTHAFTMPEYIGSVRVMVVAGQDGAYGSEEKAVPVRKPLMVLGTLPRVVGPGEKVKLPVTVFAMDPSIKNVKVSVEVNELFTIDGPDNRSLVFKATGDQLTGFDLKVPEATGIGRIRIIASSGKETAEHTIEISVRNPNPEITDVYEKSIPPGGSWAMSYMPAGIPGTNHGTLELSTIPPLNLEKRLGFLIRYPYGCIEQTTSSVFPQLFIENLVTLSDENRKKTGNHIREAIRKLKSFQIANGGLGYWPGSSYADDWGTCYAGHFLLEAEKKGYALPVSFLPAWKEYQRQKAVSWVCNASSHNDDLVQAYRLFTLALAKSPETGAMNRLLEKKDLSTAARWQLAKAYQVSGKNEIALKLINAAPVTVPGYREMGNTYGSDLRDKAMIVDVLCLLNMKTKATPLVQEISAQLAGDDWLSTQSTAFALMAITAYTGNASGSGINATYRIDGGETLDAIAPKPLAGYPVDPVPGRKGTVQVANKGKNILFARLILHGIPAKGDTTMTASGLKMTVSYKSLMGAQLSPRVLEQGTSFFVQVTVTNPGMRGKYRQLALNQVFPSGWEIVNARNSSLAESTTAASSFEYQDVRDDRVSTFFDLAAGESKTFKVMLMATYIGRFYLPPATCAAMYDNSISARVPGFWVLVEPAKR